MSSGDSPNEPHTILLGAPLPLSGGGPERNPKGVELKKPGRTVVNLIVAGGANTPGPARTLWPLIASLSIKFTPRAVRNGIPAASNPRSSAVNNRSGCALILCTRCSTAVLLLMI